jgi:hypothetical protein
VLLRGVSANSRSRSISVRDTLVVASASRSLSNSFVSFIVSGSSVKVREVILNLERPYLLLGLLVSIRLIKSLGYYVYYRASKSI